MVWQLVGLNLVHHAILSDCPYTSGSSHVAFGLTGGLEAPRWSPQGLSPHGELDCLTEPCNLIVVDYRRANRFVFPLTFADPAADTPVAHPQAVQPAFTG